MSLDVQENSETITIKDKNTLRQFLISKVWVRVISRASRSLNNHKSQRINFYWTSCWHFLLTITIRSIKKNRVIYGHTSKLRARLMTTSPLYPCGKSYSMGTHNQSVIKLPYFFLHQPNFDGIMASNPMRILSVLQSNRNFYHICRN